MQRIATYILLWMRLTVNSFSTYLTSPLAATLFVIGKLFRFVSFIIFLLVILTKTGELFNYTVAQVIFFFITFTILDTLSQLLFREVYSFRQMVVHGEFDLVLIKPMNPLFRVLVGGADPMDLAMMIPYIGALVYTAGKIGTLSAGAVGAYVLLLINGLLIAMGFHILVLALAIVSTQVDHTIMIYRDLTNMGRIPVDIYREPLRSIITFVVPVGVMMTFPVKALFGLLSPSAIMLSFVFGIVFFLICLRLWRFSLTKYTSASS